MTALRIVCGFAGALLLAYLASCLWNGDIRFGVGGSRRMGSSAYTVHLDTPLALAVGTAWLGTLAFGLLAMAARPAFFLRRSIVIPTVAVFVLAQLAVSLGPWA